MATKSAKKTELKEDKQLRDYELVYITSPEISEEALEAIIKGVSQFITGKGGIISGEDRWGKKKLAYPIKHFQEGNYILTRFKMNPRWSRELEANLLITENIIRHLLVRIE